MVRRSRASAVLIGALTLAGCTGNTASGTHAEATPSPARTPSTAVASGLLVPGDVPGFVKDVAARRSVPMATCIAGASAMQRSSAFRGPSGIGLLDVEAELLDLEAREASAALAATPQQDACLVAAAQKAVQDSRREVNGAAPQLKRSGTRWTVTMMTTAGDVVSRATVALDVKAVARGLVVLQVTAYDTHAPESFSRRLLDAAAQRA
jgi:hypothetical protein